MSNRFSSLPRQEILKQLYWISSQSSNATVQYHQAAAEKFGLNATDMKTIPLLQSGGSLSAGELATSLGLTTGAVTAVIDRLESVGLVRREADTSDRRKVLVQLVPEKIAEAGKVYAPMANAVQKLYEGYTTEQLATIAHFMESSIAIMTEQTVKLRQK